MARNNGPIKVWTRTDTVPLDSDGGYAGGDSTAAAIAQAAADLRLQVDSKATLTPSATPGLLDYALAVDTTTPVTLLSDTFAGDGALNGRAATTGGKAWTAGTGWTTSAGRAVASGAHGAALDPARSDDLDALFDLALVTTGTGAIQTWRLFVAAGAPSASNASLVNGVWGAVSIDTNGLPSAALWKTVGGVSTGLVSSIPLTGLTGNSATTQNVRATMTLRDGQATLRLTSIDSATVYGTGTAPVTPADLSGTWAGVMAATTATPGFALDALTVTRPRVPADNNATSQIVTATDGDLPDPVLASLDARYASSSALEQLRTLRAIGDGVVRVGVMSDSTANDPADWVRLWQQKWGSDLSSRVRRTYRAWNDTTAAWGAEIVDNAGTAPDLGIIVTDTFARTGEVVGSTPDTGPAWTGQAGYWTADGSKATSTGTGFGSITTNLASGDQLATIHLIVSTTAPAASQGFRVYLGAKGIGSGVYLILTLSTSGALTAQLYKALPTGTALGSAVTVAGVTAGQTGVALTIDVSTTVQAVSAKIAVGGQTTTLTAQISEAEVFERGTNLHISGGVAGSYFAAIDRVHLRTPAADNPPPTPLLAVHNGATAGAGLTFWNATKRAAVFGSTTLDVVVISLGHNQQTQSPADFVSGVATLVAAVRAEHPGAAVLVSSQNPQVTPASGITAHRARQAALRVWAKGAGLDYVPAFEAFTAEADGGTSLIGADGVHPTTPPAGVLTGAYGSVLWADTAVIALNG